MLIRAAGTTFSSGDDITVFQEHANKNLSAFLRRNIDHFHRALERLAGLPVPVVTAVRGAAAGGALGLVCVSDLVIAAPDSKFTLGYATIGLTGDGATSWYLPRLIGQRRAHQMFLQNRVLNATEALDWSLNTETDPADQLDERATEIAHRLAQGPTAAFAGVRTLLRESWHNTPSEQLRLEQQSMTTAAQTQDTAEGVRAFLDKRRPHFTGR